MALNIKNPRVELLAAEVARLTGETKTEAIRRSLEERHQRLSREVRAEDKRTRVMRYLEEELWPSIPPAELGRRLTQAEEDEILGYGPDGF